ncbi:MAG TPA: hypothetical protein VEJ36_04240, partial [Nitrososphaerales archaeon]|nr:hypothetical protein [Nitrososphaerales archaeon]
NLINSLPTGPGGNSENIMLLEKQTGLRVGDSLVYSYMPLRLDEPGSSVVANAGAKERPMLEVLGFPQNSQNVFSAELEYSSRVLEEAMMSVTEIELSRKAREARVVVHSDKDVYMSEFSRHLHDLRAIQASDEAGESISYLAGATLKSLENYVRYLVDETREILKERELKASRTKISLVWDLDRYEMRGDRLQLAESIQQRLRDYVTDVEIVSSSKVKGGGEVLDPLKHNVVIACSRADYESLKHLRKGHGEGDVTVIKATPALSRE